MELKQENTTEKRGVLNGYSFGILRSIAIWSLLLYTTAVTHTVDVESFIQ